MNRFVKANAEWLKCYDNSIEEYKIQQLVKSLLPSTNSTNHILDVGCGNGRSSFWLRKMFPHTEITAIDINAENIEYAKQNKSIKHVQFLTSNAFDFFKNTKATIKYDIIMFSWSLFDMVALYDQSEKYHQLNILIEQAKQHLNSEGCIIVTQPTKGGTFEKLLSKFMPDSDEDYYITHQYLIDSNFIGPKDALPSIYESYAIWSNFECTEEELFSGVSSVLMLETGAKISKRDFCKILYSFAEENNINIRKKFKLSDCVNLYYWQNKKL